MSQNLMWELVLEPPTSLRIDLKHSKLRLQLTLRKIV